MKTKQKLRRATTSGTRFSAALVQAAEAGGGVIELLAVARALVAEMAAAAEAKLAPHEASILISRTLMAALAEKPSRPFAPLVRRQHLLSPADAEDFCLLLAAKLVDSTPGKVDPEDDPLIVASERLIAELSAAAAPAPAPKTEAPPPSSMSLVDADANASTQAEADAEADASADADASASSLKKEKIVTARALVPALFTYARGTAGLEYASEHLISELAAATGGRPKFVLDEECAGIVGTVAGLTAALEGFLSACNA